MKVTYGKKENYILQLSNSFNEQTQLICSVKNIKHFFYYLFKNAIHFPHKFQIMLKT